MVVVFKMVRHTVYTLMSPSYTMSLSVKACIFSIRSALSERTVFRFAPKKGAGEKLIS